MFICKGFQAYNVSLSNFFYAGFIKSQLKFFKFDLNRNSHTTF
jgi:hypothetical protein